MLSKKPTAWQMRTFLGDVDKKEAVDSLGWSRCSFGLWSRSIHGHRSWGLGVDPLKYVGGVRVCFRSVKMSYSFIQNCCWITLQVSPHQWWKTLVKKWKVKLIYRGSYRLSGTGIVECLEIIDVGYNLKQFDGLTWLTLVPRLYTRSVPLGQCIHVCADKGLRYALQWEPFYIHVHRCHCSGVAFVLFAFHDIKTVRILKLHV